MSEHIDDLLGVDKSSEQALFHPECLTHTLATFKPYFLIGPMEERYLSGDVQTSDGRRQTINSVELAVRARLASIEDASEEFTPSRIDELTNEEERQRRAIGPELLDRANELGILTQLINPDQMKYIVGREYYEEDFTYNGWQVYRLKDGSLILVVSSSHENATRL